MNFSIIIFFVDDISVNQQFIIFSIINSIFERTSFDFNKSQIHTFSYLTINSLTLSLFIDFNLINLINFSFKRILNLKSRSSLSKRKQINTKHNNEKNLTEDLFNKYINNCQFKNFSFSIQILFAFIDFSKFSSIKFEFIENTLSKIVNFDFEFISNSVYNDFIHQHFFNAFFKLFTNIDDMSHFFIDYVN